MMHSSHGKKSGFTLIELLFVVGLIAVISLAMFAVFNNGIKIWQRINGQLPEEEAAIFMDRFFHDLRNSIASYSIKFSGSQKQMVFATLVNSPRLKNTSVGRVTYFYDPGSYALSRQQDDYSSVCTGEEGGPLRTLGNITALKFQYYFFDKDRKEYFWLDEWSRDSVPLAVNIEMEMDDGGRVHKFSQALFIPVAG